MTDSRSAASIPPWVVRVEHDPLRHVLRLYDASGDFRVAVCSAVPHA